MAMANQIEGRPSHLFNTEGWLGHAPESIQSHSAAIVIKEPELSILQVSANTRLRFGYAPEELLDQPLSLLLGDIEVERLRNQLLSKNLGAAPHYLPAVRIGKESRLFELLVHRRRGMLILECEPKPDDANTRLDLAASLSGAIARLRRSGGVGEACQIVVDEARRFTGFDRVMIYKFKKDGSGAVIAESLGGDFKPCLGAQFPPSNITQQATAIYRTGRLLMKVDVNDHAVSMVPPVKLLAGEPIDMSQAVTRDLAPDYGERLRKTGVTALMFIPITKNERLWGLIMFYNHTGPKYVSHNARMACELLAQYLSLQTVATEATNNHKQMARLVSLNAELERRNFELDSFACIASHDLKEPLRGIHRYSNFLIEDYADKLDKAGLEKLQTVVNLAQRMETLVNSLLHFSRVGQAELALREVDLDEVVNKTMELIEPRLQESGAEIRRPRRLPIVQADYACVGEIFHNLIINAIKYNDKPMKWIEIGWEDGAEDKENYHSTFPIPHSPIFYVRDNGIGIPERHYETIFSIFKRLHERNEFGGGVGAGLTIVKKIVERHNGRIWIDSCIGAGTTIYFTLG